MTKKKRIQLSIILILLLVGITLIPSVQAAACTTSPDGCWINGTIYRWDTNSALSGVTVANASNTTQTSTTGANGYFNISWFDYSNTTASGGHNLTITAPASYTTGNSIIKIEIADVSTSNDTGITTIRPKTPTQTSISAASVTKTGATISWTSNISADNRVTYGMDSSLGGDIYRTSYSNTTTSPSFTLSNLIQKKTWYYRVDTWNSVNNTYNAQSSILNFTTLHGTYIEEPSTYSVSVGTTPTSQANSPPLSVSGNEELITEENSGTVVIGIIVIVVLYLLLFSGSKKRRK